jgi:hypothetical protein
MYLSDTVRRDGPRIWVGYHLRFGLVVYDSRMQIWRNDTDVSLYIVEEKSFRLFNKSAVRPRLMPLTRRVKPIKLVETLKQYGGIADIAVRYAENLAENRSELSSQPLSANDLDSSETYSHEVEYEPSYDEEEERRLLTEEMMEAQEAWVRSEDEGWFYED